MSLNLPTPEQSQTPFEQLKNVILDLRELSDLDIFTVQKSEAGHTSRTHEYENGIYVGVAFDKAGEFVKAVIIDEQDNNIFIIQQKNGELEISKKYRDYDADTQQYHILEEVYKWDIDAQIPYRWIKAVDVIGEGYIPYDREKTYIAIYPNSSVFL